jgi:hypothetical protein
MVLALGVGGLTAALLWAQNPFDPSEFGGRGGGRSFSGGGNWAPMEPREWEADTDFPEDHFTFVRLRHNGDGGLTDYPKADHNFTRRLQELTAMEVNPRYLNIDITDERLFQYPFAFMSDLRDVWFDASEEEALRNYMLNGGFIMVDDQWGARCWKQVRDAMKGVFPDRDPVELDLKHPIFSCVFKLDALPQVPSHDAAKYWHDRGEDKHYEIKGFSGEREEDMNRPHFYAWYDDKGRIMMLVCHNNDIADGWEEENFNPWFFKKYSEKMCFPLGINIVFYALTH